MKLFSVWMFMMFSIISCKPSKDDDTNVTPAASLQTQTARNINSPSTGVDGTGRPLPSEHVIFFNFKENKTYTYTDSISDKWDIGFSATTIIVNSGSSGPANAGGQVYSGIFDQLSEAPTGGYGTDTKDAYAIKIGSGNGWYNYNATTHVVLPIPGRVLVFRTADGKYVKMEILSYYKDAPANPTSADPSGYYTFRYVYQPNGTRQF